MSAVEAAGSTPTRQQLSRTRVLAAALAYVDEHGLEALSMHKLGAALGVQGMALYNHVQGKDGLLDGIVELLWSEIEASAAPVGDWREAVRVLANTLRDVVRHHPNAAPLLMSRRVMPAPALRTCDTYLRVLRDGGVPEPCAVALLRTVFAYGFGYALAELSCFPCESATAGDDEVRRIRRLSILIPDDVPDDLVRLALQVCGDCDLSAQYALGIDLMIRGLDAYLAESVTCPRPSDLGATSARPATA